MPKLDVVLLFEQRTTPHLIDGQPPVVPYSHDQPLLHFGHESLRKGFRTFFASSTQVFHGRDQVMEIIQFYPTIKIKPASAISIKKLSPEFIVLALPAISGTKRLYPKSKFVAFLPSSALLEAPKTYTPEWLYGYMIAARNHIDFYVTQNERMADLVWSLFSFIARVDLRGRILSSHLGIVKEQRYIFPPRKTIRAEMGLASDEIAFINAGGPWHWTDYNTFLRAFCSVVRGGVKNIKFYIMGFKQPGNIDHDEYIAETKNILAKNADLVGKNIMVYDDWYQASEKVVRFTHAADIGVNVNKDTAENWQSYRVRFLEYMKAGIPVINTTGDYLSANDAADAVYLVKAGDIPSYEVAIREAATKHDLRKLKAKAMQHCARTFDSRNTYGRMIDKLMTLPKRNFRSSKEWIDYFPFEPSWGSNSKSKFDAWDIAPSQKFKRRQIISPGKKISKKWLVSSEIWRGGGEMGACQHTLQPASQLSTNDQIMTLGFLIKPKRKIAPDWSEVIQIGTSPLEARLIILANSDNKNFARFSFGFRDKNKKRKLVPVIDIKNKGPLRFIIQAIPQYGLIRVKINKTTYEIVISPWKWISTDRIWIGSRRLNANIQDLWITSENVTGMPLHKLKRKPKRIKRT